MLCWLHNCHVWPQLSFMQSLPKHKGTPDTSVIASPNTAVPGISFTASKHSKLRNVSLLIFEANWVLSKHWSSISQRQDRSYPVCEGVKETSGLRSRDTRYPSVVLAVTMTPLLSSPLPTFPPSPQISKSHI